MWDFFNGKFVVGRKDYACEECRTPMPKGTRHAYCSGVCEGEFMDYRLCEECDLISSEYCRAFDAEEGWPMSALRSSLIEDEGIADPLAWARGRRAERDAVRGAA